MIKDKNQCFEELLFLIAERNWKEHSERTCHGIEAAKERRKALALENTVNDSGDTINQIQP